MPTRLTKISLWMQAIEFRTHHNPNDKEVWYRDVFGQSTVATLWGNYPNSQKEYDAFADEWHISPALTHRKYVYEDGFADELYDTIETNAPTDESMSVQAIRDEHKRLKTAVTYFEPPIPPFIELYFLRYGIMTLPVNTTHDAANKYNEDHISRCFLLSNLKPIDNPAIVKATSMFLDGWQRTGPRFPDALVWDLHPACPQGPHLRPHPTMQVTPIILDRACNFACKYYSIWYQHDDHNWSLFLLDPVTALELYRNTSIVNTLQAVTFLVLRGAAF
ncbi:hypothetical protein GSI_09467 [Ganoderma sinense ZZ0214-1]|uniref:Uncharacterized protein n=1 Tax=Ganoderma sinense ZZ0214-1 TaxID=1077348 RepID=A0A2G8S6P2_9APHY|nr:hypothetical protein GSI_09467 [Ganoderma sinense ZZ0214-1]